jgi:transposase-like protein
MAKVKKECAKCGKEHYCDEHHILPKEIFGEGATEPLCKTCHDEFHRFLGFKFLRKKNAQPEEFYLKKWLQWLTTMIIIGICAWLTNWYFL